MSEGEKRGRSSRRSQQRRNAARRRRQQAEAQGESVKQVSKTTSQSPAQHSQPQRSLASPARPLATAGLVDAAVMSTLREHELSLPFGRLAKQVRNRLEGDITSVMITKSLERLEANDFVETQTVLEPGTTRKILTARLSDTVRASLRPAAPVSLEKIDHSRGLSS